MPMYNAEEPTKGRVYIKSSVGTLVLDITIVRYG